jgi:hypothetical protein
MHAPQLLAGAVALGLLGLAAAPVASATSLVCIADLSIVVQGEPGPTYGFRVTSTHYCVPDAAGVLIVFFDSERIEVGECSGQLVCTITIEGQAADNDCFTATAFGFGQLHDIPASGEGCGA